MAETWSIEFNTLPCTTRFDDDFGSATTVKAEANDQ